MRLGFNISTDALSNDQEETLTKQWRELKRKSAGMHGFKNSEENPAWPCVRELKKSLRSRIYTIVLGSYVSSLTQEKKKETFASDHSMVHF
jgi:hypothetical protein